jgi:F0F1-type ATP synthase membrane subunit b/b'
MKSSLRTLCSEWRRYVLCLLVEASIALPALAQEEKPSPADSPTGFVFRWLNFALIIGSFTWVIVKFGGPFFRGTAKSIQDAIHGAAAGRAAAEAELKQAERQLTSLDDEVQEMRRAAGKESAAEAERLRALAMSEAEKIAKAAAAEIVASERVASQQLRGLAARAATERAAALVRQRMNDQSERSLFDGFVQELERSTR